MTFLPPQASKHPLLGPLMTCMAALLRDHRTEIEDILAADKQLARELIFDMKQAEQAAKQQPIQVRANEAAAPQLPAATEEEDAAPFDADMAAPRTAGKALAPGGEGNRRMSEAAAKTPFTAGLGMGSKTPGLATAGKTPFTGASMGRASGAPTPAPLRSGAGRASAPAQPREEDERAETVVQLRSPDGLSREPLQPWSVNLSAPVAGAAAAAKSKGVASGKVRKATNVVHEAAAEATALLVGALDTEVAAEGARGKKGPAAAKPPSAAPAGKKRKGGRA